MIGEAISGRYKTLEQKKNKKKQKKKQTNYVHCVKIVQMRSFF